MTKKKKKKKKKKKEEKKKKKEVERDGIGHVSFWHKEETRMCITTLGYQRH